MDLDILSQMPSDMNGATDKDVSALEQKENVTPIKETSKVVEPPKKKIKKPRKARAKKIKVVDNNVTEARVIYVKEESKKKKRDLTVWQKYVKGEYNKIKSRYPKSNEPIPTLLKKEYALKKDSIKVKYSK